MMYILVTNSEISQVYDLSFNAHEILVNQSNTKLLVTNGIGLQNVRNVFTE